MNCEEATLLISARIDGDLAAGQSSVLDAHLAECEACRQTLSELELQDAALMRAFVPRQEAAFALSDRVSQSMSREHESASARDDGSNPSIALASDAKFSRCLRLLGNWAAAAAAGFLAAMAVMRPAHARRPTALPVAQTTVPLQPVARLTLATGEVFTCPSTDHKWRPISSSEPINLRDGIRTADTKCELQLPDGSRVRLNAGTEVQFTGSRTVSVAAGELWSAVPRDAAPLCVSAGLTCVTSHGTGNQQGTQFDLARTADAATVTIQHGSADVVGNGPPTTVHDGQVLRATSPRAGFVCSAAPDPLLASHWQDDLLVLKPADDPEVIARVDQLLARVSTDRQTSEVPGATEQGVRARGTTWCTPFACYIRTRPNENEARQTAARLLADLAPPSKIPDLIDLLADEDGQVRYNAAVALRRLAGQTLGYPPDRCAATRDVAAATAWREWWEQNEPRYRER